MFAIPDGGGYGFSSGIFTADALNKGTGVVDGLGFIDPGQPGAEMIAVVVGEFEKRLCLIFFDDSKLNVVVDVVGEHDDGSSGQRSR